MKSSIYYHAQKNGVDFVLNEKTCPIKPDRTGGIFVEYLHVYLSGATAPKCIGFNGNGIPYIGTVTEWSDGKFFYQCMTNEEYIKYKDILDALLVIKQKNILIPELGHVIMNALYK